MLPRSWGAWGQQSIQGGKVKRSGNQILRIGCYNSGAVAWSQGWTGIPGISLPWVVWIKVMPGPPSGPAVESAYLAADPPKGGEVQTFRFVIEQTRRTGAPYGLPSRGRA